MDPTNLMTLAWHLLCCRGAPKGVSVKLPPKLNEPAARNGAHADPAAAPQTRREAARTAAQAKRRKRKAAEKEAKAAAASKKQRKKQSQEPPLPPVERVWSKLVWPDAVCHRVQQAFVVADEHQGALCTIHAV